MSGRERVVVVGASGFGREALDVIEAMGRVAANLDIIGVLDDNPSEVNRSRLADRGVTYLGGVDQWLADGDRDARFVLGVGNPMVRRGLAQRFERAGLRAFTAVHPTSTFGALAHLAEGVIVCAGAVVSTNVSLGRHVHVNPHATIGHDAVLHDFVSVNPAATISGEVEIGEGVLVGASATILQNLKVKSGAVIGAGAVVTKEVPSGAVVRGVPGRWH